MDFKRLVNVNVYDNNINKVRFLFYRASPGLLKVDSTVHQKYHHVLISWLTFLGDGVSSALVGEGPSLSN